MGRPPKDLSRGRTLCGPPAVLVGPPDHASVVAGGGGLDALAKRCAARAQVGSGTRDAMESFFHEHRFEPRGTMEMSSNERSAGVMGGSA